MGWKQESNLIYEQCLGAIASQEVMEEPLKLCNAIKIPARSFVVAPTYCSQMFTGRVCARPSDELKHRFPNLYMEPKILKLHWLKPFKISRKLLRSSGRALGDANVDIVLRTIKDPTALYLRQHLTAGGVEVVDPPEELPSGQEFMRQLPERARRAEEMAFITDIFSHVAQAHEHLSEVVHKHQCPSPKLQIRPPCCQ